MNSNSFLIVSTKIYKIERYLYLMKKLAKKLEKTKKTLFRMREEDFTKENFIEGGIVRPLILIIAFFTFILAMFLLLIGELKWGGSLIIFSFILNQYSIYESLKDEPSIFKKMNLAFKFMLFTSEIVGMGFVLSLI